MPWFNFQVPEVVKKRMATYLIDYYLGSFLDNPISHEDLSLSLFQGEVILTNIDLDVAALNNELEQYKVPFEVLEGFIEEISVRVPWTTILSDSTVIEVHGLEITLKPKKRSDDEGLGFDSMLYNSMTASMQERCVIEDELESTLNADDMRFLGSFNCAQAIDAVFSRIKVRFLNTVFRLEHVLRDSSTGAALEIKITKIEYFDDMANSESCPAQNISDDRKAVYEAAAIACRNLHLTGIQIFCDELKADTSSPQRPQTTGDFPDSTMPRLDSFSESAEFSNMLNSCQPVITGQPTSSGWSSGQGEQEKFGDAIPDPVLVMELCGTQEIKIRLKCKEDLPGPKLDLDCRLGTLHIYLSPHLLHMLLEVFNGITSPGVSEGFCVRRATNKRMDEEDYRKVEQELRRCLPKQNEPGSIVRVRQHAPSTSDDGLSSHPIDDDDDDDDNDEDDIYMSVANNLSGTSSLESSMASLSAGQQSSSSGSVPAFKQNKKPMKKHFAAKSKGCVDEASKELNKLKLRFGFLSIMILHENPSSSPSDLKVAQSAALDQMRVAAKKYFEKVKSIPLTGISTAKDLTELRGKFSSVCQEDHVSILCKSVVIDLTQQSSPSNRSLTVDVCVSLLEIVDAVFSHNAATASMMGFHLPIDNILPDYCELLRFYDDESTRPASSNVMFNSMHMNNPCIRANIKLSEYLARSSRRGSVSPPKTEIKMDVAKCKVEVDITIVDRIHAILNPESSSSKANGFNSSSRLVHLPLLQTDRSMFSQAIEDEDPATSNGTLDVQIACSSLTLDIRFPKVDLSSHRVDKPWWKRSLHPEHLILALDSAKFKTNLNKMDTVTEFEITCRSGEGFFQMENESPCLFLRIATDDMSSEGFNWPRMMVRMFPVKQSVLETTLDEKELPPEGDNGEYVCMRSESLPFSSKKVMYDNKELLCPGDRHDMMDFQDKTLGNALLSIELSLQNVIGFLPSKDFFEVAYNRLLNDLLLWEPAAPIPKDVPEPYSLGCGVSWSPEFVPQLMQHGNVDDDLTFSTSGDGYGSSSETDESDEFFPMNDQKSRQQKHRPPKNSVLQPSKMCLTLSISHGSLTAYAPLKSEDGVVRKDVCGEFLLEVVDFSLLAVIGHGGDPEVQYICAQIHNVTLFHNGFTEIHCSQPDLNYILRSCKHLLPTIYLSEDGIPSRLRNKVGQQQDGQEDMFSMTIKITGENFTSQKTYLIAAGLRGTTLRHRTCQSKLSWFEQLTDFFNVTDFDIPGYTLPKVMTELHCYLWSCAIDYRPLYLPYRALVTVETFSFMSNILAESSISVLRFLLDDAALFLSDKVSVERVDVRNNYVCVVDLGAFELCLCMSNGQNLSHPKVELTASNNVINIRTCSDSFTVLAELINYLARCGDLDDDARLPKELHPANAAAVTSNPYMTDSSCVEENLPDLMEDAMREPHFSSELSDSDSCTEPEPIRELYFLPTDGKVYYQSPQSPASSMSSSCSSTTPHRAPRPKPQIPNTQRFSDLANDISDEEFCIIDEPGLGNKPRNGDPVVRVHAQDPLKVIENHFNKPLTKTDLLKAPDHFPPAVYRYTIKEISVVWFMYGGRDFESSALNKFGNSSPKSVPKNKVGRSSSESLLWQVKGGVGRDHNTVMELHLSKVRMQHETYPDGVFQVSRQVLLVNEIEILDKLVVSDINKFLLLYSSDSIPRQSHANMLMIKALHVRPDLSRPNEQECSLKVTVQPIRLNIDQDALFFLRNFFTEIGSGMVTKESDSRPPSAASVGRPRSGEPPSSINSTPKRVPTAPSTASQPPSLVTAEPISPEPLMTFDDFVDAVAKTRVEREAKEVEKETEVTPEENTLPVYFKSFVFTHDVPIRLDYQGKWVDMDQGTVTGLIVGLAQLNCSELRLRRLNHQCGLLGFERLVVYALNEWLQDIKKNQLPSLLVGVGPLHSLYQLAHGCKDLIWLPVEQYRKDGRIMRGIQRGTHSFVTYTAISMIELTNRLVLTIQSCAETAYDIVSPGPSFQTKKKTTRRRKGMTHPADLREGVTNAITIVKEGMCETAANIYNAAVEEHEHKGVTGAIGGIIRQIPSTVIKPVIFTSEATSSLLGGMRNHIHPDRKKEDEEKWKSSPAPR